MGLKQTLSKHWLKAILPILVSFISISCILFLPRYLFSNYEIVHSYPILEYSPLIVLGTISFISLISLFAIKPYRDKSSRLFQELRYLYFDAAVGFIFAVSFASTLTIIIALLSKGSSTLPYFLSANAYNIAGIYLSCVFGVFALRYFFDSLLPITMTEKLLKRLTIDINNLQEDEEIWFCFPGLNIGQFRDETELISDIEFNKFYGSIQQKIQSNSHQFNAFVYSDEIIDKFYTKYSELYDLDDAILSKAKEKCISNAKALNHTFLNMHQENNSKLYFLEPNQFMEYFIIIGEVVYFVEALGFPIYKEDCDGNYEFQNLKYQDAKNNEKLIKLIAFRQENSNLAMTLKKRMNVYISTLEINPQQF